MNFEDAVAYYTELMQSGVGFGAALAWTVIRPLGDPLPLEDAATRLIGGGHPELVESDEEFTEEAEFLEGKAVYLGRAGAATMMVEPGGFSYVRRPQVMAWLSRDAQVWHLSWNVKGMTVLEYAAHGQWLARAPELDLEMLHGVDPSALEKEAAALQEVASAPWPTQKATAMAIIELRTGARLPMDWWDHPHPVAIVDPLISDECPPIALWHYEPDLAARVQLTSQETRQAILLRLANALIERFDLGQPIIQAVRSANDHLPLNPKLLEEVRVEWESLGRPWAGRGFAVRAEDEDAWHRWVAANAVRHTLRSLNEGASYLDGVTYARFALAEQWPETRNWMREMTRDASS
jgi:hypothetical protein